MAREGQGDPCWQRDMMMMMTAEWDGSHSTAKVITLQHLYGLR